MEPSLLGQKYDKIATWWQERHQSSNYGISQIQKAVSFASTSGKALDVGCGAGGRIINILQDKSYAITGLDISSKMIELATQNHPNETFLHQDICTWDTPEKFEIIIAWDSLFHLPLAMHRPVLSKLSNMLTPKGVLIYTFGNATGEDTSEWHNDTYYYSSIGIKGNIESLLENDMSILHLELDQYPEKHVYIIAVKQ